MTKSKLSRYALGTLENKLFLSDVLLSIHKSVCSNDLSPIFRTTTTTRFATNREIAKRKLLVHCANVQTHLHLTHSHTHTHTCSLISICLQPKRKTDIATQPDQLCNLYHLVLLLLGPTSRWFCGLCSFSSKCRPSTGDLVFPSFGFYSPLS